MGNVIMKAQQITYGASNVEKALDDLKAPELIELNKRMDAVDAWKANVHEETYTGSELTIENALALPARSLITSINAIQDLHGYDHPWVGGAGKNKVESAQSGGTVAHVTYTRQSDGKYNANGTSDDWATYIINSAVPLKAGNYIISGSPNIPDTYVSIVIGDTAPSSMGGNEQAFTITEDGTYTVRLSAKSGVVLNNAVFAPMIREASAPSGFAPYSNICPISGRTEARVDTENEDSSESAYAVIQLGTTVYGADINWDTGVMSVGDISITFDGSSNEGWSRYSQGSASAYAMQIDNTTGNSDTNVRPMTNGASGLNSSDTYGNYYCFISTSHGANWIAGRRGISTVEDWKTWLASNPIQVCYKLATPTTLQLTPTQLQMLKGYNRVTIESGSIELTALVLGGDN